MTFVVQDLRGVGDLTVGYNRMQSSSSALLPRARGLITASPAKRQCVTATLAPVRQRPATPPKHAPTSVSISTPLAQPPTLPQQQPRPAVAPTPTGRVVLEDPEELKSTWVHRAWVGGTSLLLAGVLANGLAGVHDTGSAAAAAAALLAAYLTADFGSAVYHWGVDNYGSGETWEAASATESWVASCIVMGCASVCVCVRVLIRGTANKLPRSLAAPLLIVTEALCCCVFPGETPLVGSQIAAFQGHHQRPWTITEREFCNNVHKVGG